MFLLSFPFEDEGWVWPVQLFNRTQGHTLHSVEIISLDKKKRAAAAAESSFNTVDLEAQNPMLFILFFSSETSTLPGSNSNRSERVLLMFRGGGG